jgi:hypothetical protein
MSKKRADAVDSASRGRYVPPYAIALVHGTLGDRDEVFAWLERAKNARDVHLIFLFTDPKWDPYRADARFVDLLATLQVSSTSGTLDARVDEEV